MSIGERCELVSLLPLPHVSGTLAKPSARREREVSGSAGTDGRATPLTVRPDALTGHSRNMTPALDWLTS